MVDIAEPDAAEKAFMESIKPILGNPFELHLYDWTMQCYRKGRMDEARKHSHELNAILSICESMTRNQDPQDLTP